MTAITSPLAYFVCMAWFLCVAYLLARARPESSVKLNVPMESLRGLLATGVFFCHAVATYFYFKTGTWKSPPSAFYEYLGTGTVDMFFFLSGFLFWSKFISDKGVRNMKDFFIARARRIVPAYYVSVLLIVLVVFAHTRFSLRVSPLQLGVDLLVWLLFCIPNYLQPINGVQQAPMINAAVIWTLELEIVFYALLPFLYRVFKGYRVFAYVSILALTFWYMGHFGEAKSSSWAEQPVPMLLARFFGFGFGFGMLAAFVVSKCPQTLLASLRQRRWSLIPILFLAAPVLLGLPAHSFFQFVLLLVPFMFVVAGNDLFGLLSMRSTLLLGKSSYSFYVTHGIFLYGFSHILNRWQPITTLGPASYWFFMACCGTATICFTYFLYRNVELPFMKKGSVLRQAGARTDTPDLDHRHEAPKTAEKAHS